jgi:hypothetical protein
LWHKCIIPATQEVKVGESWLKEKHEDISEKQTKSKKGLSFVLTGRVLTLQTVQPNKTKQNKTNTKIFSK